MQDSRGAIDAVDVDRATAPATLTDPALEARFERDGWVVVPFLSADEVAEVRALYRRLRPDRGTGFVTDFEDADQGVRAEVADALAPLWRAHLPRVLRDHRPFMSSFLMKWPDDGSELYVHQDWTYVDERRWPSVSVWVALDATSTALDNGPLHVVPGSHRVTHSYRGSNTPAWYSPYEQFLRERSVAVDAAPGEAVIMDNRLVHWSPPNRSSAPRLALAGAVVPSAAQLIHAVDQGDGAVRIHAVDDEFFATTTPARLFGGEAIDRPVIGFEPWQDRPVDAATFEAAIGVPLPASADDSAAPGGPLGSSAAPEGGTGLVERALTGVLRINHRSVSAVVADHGALLSVDEVPMLADLEAAWPEVRAEYDALIAGTVPPTMEAITGAEMPVVGRWSAIVLRDNAGWIDCFADRVPRTVAMLRTLPGLRAALFSVTAPGARITPHRGANRGVIRLHLGVTVPGPPGACTLQVGAEHVAWAEGKAFAFDDTFEHAVTNRADEPRVSLMLEVDRVLPGRAAWLNRAVQPAFRLHPQVRGSHRRLTDLDRAMNG